jgi:hypothetical protein
VIVIRPKGGFVAECIAVDHFFEEELEPGCRLQGTWEWQPGQLLSGQETRQRNCQISDCLLTMILRQAVNR